MLAGEGRRKGSGGGEEGVGRGGSAVSCLFHERIRFSLETPRQLLLSTPLLQWPFPDVPGTKDW